MATMATSKNNKNKNLSLIGPPGSGKGSYGKHFAEALQVPIFTVSDLLRTFRPDLDLTDGKLVDDTIVGEIILKGLLQLQCRHRQHHDEDNNNNNNNEAGAGAGSNNKGYILDGFPRTLAQTKALDKMLAEEGACVTKVVELEVPDSVLEERITGRWIHKSSGRSYHVKYAPPKSMKTADGGKPVAESMKDDVTGEALMQRKDDTADALKKRLASYHNETVPILKHYAPNGIVKAVNANQNMDGVWTEVLAQLKRSSA